MPQPKLDTITREEVDRWLNTYNSLDKHNT
jgi:hypothetical protein